MLLLFFIQQKTAYEMRISDWSSDVCSSDLEPDGTVCVDGETIGRLDGFRFSVDPATRHQDRKMLLAAAERRLGRILRVKADELLGAPDTDFALTDEAGQAPGISWQGNPVASLHGGSALLAPEIRLDRALLALGQDVQKQVATSLAKWFDAQQEKSDERRVGKEWVSTCRSRWSPDH